MPKLKVVKQNYPQVPEDASVLDVVEEYYVYYDDDDKLQRAFIGAVYCPKNPTTDSREPFDPSTPEAQAALEKMKPKVKKIRRYDKDIKRRRALQEA